MTKDQENAMLEAHQYGRMIAAHYASHKATKDETDAFLAGFINELKRHTSCYGA